jgi:putative flippase GtrA
LIDRCQIARFALVGVANTAVDIGLFALLFYVGGAPLLWANSLSYLAAGTNSFFLNKYWTFGETRHKGRMQCQIVLFFVLGIVGLALSNAVVWGLASMMPEFIGKILTVGVLFLWNFAVSRLIVFPRKAGQGLRPKLMGNDVHRGNG